jgi:class 3 adenylate cyclase
MSDSQRVDRIATLLIADIEGSTPFRAAVGDELAQRHIDGVLRTVGDAVSAGGGEVIKAMGDGVLALFEAPGPAFDAAVRIQRAMVDSDVKVRIGVHAGQLKVSEGDVHGMAVHVADRVTRVAAGGEIVVSAMARALASPSPAGAGRIVARRLFEVWTSRSRCTSSSTPDPPTRRWTAGVRQRS